MSDDRPKLRVLDLFSGIGGFSLGLERTGGFETVAFCEIEPYCQAVLRKHWPDVPIFDDVRELTADAIGPVDVICGGFPVGWTDLEPSAMRSSPTSPSKSATPSSKRKERAESHEEASLHPLRP